MGAQLRVFRRRIKSVQATKKITKAMELIASSRIVKAQQRLDASTPYLIHLTQAISAAASHAGDIQPPAHRPRRGPQAGRDAGRHRGPRLGRCLFG